MKLKKSLLSMAILASLSGPAIAAVEFNTRSNDELLQNPVAGIEKQSRLYYKIGGARPISTPPVNYSEINVGTDLKFGAGYSCGKFDPTLSLQNFMNQLTSGVDDAMNTMQQAATSAVASLPALIMQRNSPDIYELLQTNVFRAEEKWKFNSASCQEMERKISNGENPYKQWTMFAQSTELKEEAESNPDANDAMEKVQQNAGDSGVYFPVPGKGVVKAGGVGQQPIKVTSSATVVGYNTMLKRDPTEMSEPADQSNIDSRLVRTFPTPEAAKKWMIEVLGEQEIYTTDTPDNQPESIAGTGLLTQASKEQAEIHNKLLEAISTPSASGNSVNSEARGLYVSLSSESLIIDEGLIGQLKNKSPEEQTLLINALSGEIALNKEIEKALVARRILISSLAQANLNSAKQVSAEIEKNITDLEKEINQSMFEYRLRRELVSGLAQEIMKPTIKNDASPNSELGNAPSYQAKE